MTAFYCFPSFNIFNVCVRWEVRLRSQKLLVEFFLVFSTTLSHFTIPSPIPFLIRSFLLSDTALLFLPFIEHDSTSMTTRRVHYSRHRGFHLSASFLYGREWR